MLGIIGMVTGYHVKILISAGVFSAKYHVSLRADEFEQFLHSLEVASNDLKAKIEFSSMEMWLEVQASGDGLGHFVGECIATDMSGHRQTQLKFPVEFDQTEVPSMLAQFRSIWEEFPVIR